MQRPVGITHQLPRERDQIGVAVLEERFGMLGLASVLSQDAFASSVADAWLTGLRDPTRAAQEGVLLGDQRPTPVLQVDRLDLPRVR